MSHTNQQKGMLLTRLLQKAMLFKAKNQNQNQNQKIQQIPSESNLPKNTESNSRCLNRDISVDSIDQSFFTGKDDLNEMLKYIYVQLFGQQKYQIDMQRYFEIQIHPEKYKEAADFNKQGKLMENIILQIRQLKRALIGANKELKMLKKIQKQIQIQQKSNPQSTKMKPQQSNNSFTQKISISQELKQYNKKIEQLSLQVQQKQLQIVRINHLNQKKLIKIQQLQDLLNNKQSQIFRLLLNLEHNLKQIKQFQTDRQQTKLFKIQQNQNNNKIKCYQQVKTSSIQHLSAQKQFQINKFHVYQQKISLLKQQLVQSKKNIHNYQKQIEKHQSQIQKYQQFIGQLSNQIQICQKKLCLDKKQVANKKVQTECFAANTIESPEDMKNFQKYFQSPQTPNFRQTSIADMVQVDSQLQQSQNLARMNTFNKNNISKISKMEVTSDKQSITLSQFSETEELKDIRNLTKQLSEAYDKIISLTYQVNNLKKQNKNIMSSTAFIKKDPQFMSKKLIKQK